MKVYLGKECYYDGCEYRREVVKVFDDEAKALVWKENCWSNDNDDPNEWREYEEMELE